MTERRPTADIGSADLSVEMMFGTVVLVVSLLVLFEAIAHWHARAVFDDAAADGARIAAAHDGSCEMGVAVARAAIDRHAAGWGRAAQVSCTDGDDVTVRVVGPTPGVLAASLRLVASVEQTQPNERRCCQP